MAKNGRSCELCSSDARMFCESDQARLCWDCDEKVHAANFLVAKHTRTALCHVCHSTTPWKASGPMLGRTVSVCGVCVSRSTRAGRGSAGCGGFVAGEEEPAPLTANVRIAGGGYERQEGTGADDDSEDDDEYESGDEDISDSDGGDEFDCGDDDDENQVVPWTSTPPSPPPASTTSTSCSDEEDSSSFVGCESASTSRFRDLPFTFHSSLTSENGVRGPISPSITTRSRVTPGEIDEDIIGGGGGFARPLKYRRLETEPNKRLSDLSR